jgi:hypothetical protein
VPKLERPTRDNRDSSLAFLWQRLGLTSSVSAHDGTNMAMLQDNLQHGRAPQAGLVVNYMSRDELDIWLLERWKGGAAADGHFSRAFNLAYWAQEVLLTHRRVQGWSDDVSDDTLYDLLGWQGLAAASGAAWFTDWVAPHLHNLFASGGVSKTMRFFAVDEPALRFTQLLQATLITARWPTADELQHLGAYSDLFAKAAEPSDFAGALVDYCDYRVAECFGYHGMDAAKRRRPSVDESIMDRGSWEQVFPVELLTLRYAFQKATGAPLSLEASHALLQTPLMKVPWPVVAVQEDEAVVASLRRLAQSSYGNQWKLRQSIAPRYL